MKAENMKKGEVYKIYLDWRDIGTNIMCIIYYGKGFQDCIVGKVLFDDTDKEWIGQNVEVNLNIVCKIEKVKEYEVALLLLGGQNG